MHVFPGMCGIVVSTMIPIGIYALFYRATRNSDSFIMDSDSKPGSFEPTLAKYLKISETIVGLASASIVLIVGTSALKDNATHLSARLASPLFLLAACVLYGITCSVWLIHRYEHYSHGGNYSRRAYCFSNAVGFAGLACFVVGYVWLIAAAVR